MDLMSNRIFFLIYGNPIRSEEDNKGVKVEASIWYLNEDIDLVVVVG